MMIKMFILKSRKHYSKKQKLTVPIQISQQLCGTDIIILLTLNMTRKVTTFLEQNYYQQCPSLQPIRFTNLVIYQGHKIKIIQFLVLSYIKLQNIKRTVMNKPSKNNHTINHQPKDTAQKLSNLEVSLQQLKTKVSEPAAPLHTSKLKTEASRSKSIPKHNNKPHNISKSKVHNTKNKHTFPQNQQKQNGTTFNNTDRAPHHKQSTSFQCQSSAQSSILRLSQILSALPYPKQGIREINQYYYIISEAIREIEDQCLCRLLTKLHEMYTMPVQGMIELISPYQSLLLKRRDAIENVSSQIQKNIRLSGQLNYRNQLSQISRLERIVEQQRKEINQLQKQLMSSRSQCSIISIGGEEREVKQKQQKQFNGFKINLSSLKQNKQLGYHQQFMAMLPQMSQSWRQQALRQKRY